MIAATPSFRVNLHESRIHFGVDIAKVQCMSQLQKHLQHTVLTGFGHLRKLSMYDTSFISNSVRAIETCSGPVLKCEELEKLTALQYLQEVVRHTAHFSSY